MQFDFVSRAAGHTGHVPFRQFKIAITNGNANREC